ncbi:unnamed protein product [Didymodactylos carnosus]|uniref:Mutator-like transposase domain-containing protein n=1 Tax=Didymodactylos carnosus TaxID=1234261 RepID=A0A8S2Q3R1_9BILA|nr:unnamed protein product [Didymodactylos carnosus]CAF4083128.1 unnamed protein product [Didymodactylos carnosus]CAF4478532.1 unnamed protein product [Didymodactylos carnosus]
MEAEGASRIFQRSVSKGLRYKWLVCDGDSSAYDKVKNIYIEQETAAEADGIDNNDKHKGRQPREVVRMKKTIPEEKPFGGSAGRMTDAMMHKMSEMYGLAIRQGTDEVQENNEDEAEAVARLQKKCLAAFHHLIVQDNKENQHYYCPDGMTSWCSYKRDQATNGNEDERKDKNWLDPVFLDLLQKMIEDLTLKELLSRCLRGLTQNSNESLNSVVWSILSKSKNHGFSSVQGAATAASIYFTGGRA